MSVGGNAVDTLLVKGDADDLACGREHGQVAVVATAAVAQARAGLVEGHERHDNHVENIVNCVSTIDSATSGTIRINGQDVTRMKQAKLSQFRREELGFIFQDSNLLDTLTARENIALPLTIARTNSAEISTRVQDVAARLSISQVLDKYPYQMSGGQQQRVAAARALVTDPTMIMADEPTGALDSKSARLLLESLEALNRRLRATVLMVTHDSFAASYTSRVLFIRDGKIFTELRRGDTDRREFFDRIMEVVAMMGGEGSDAL